SIPTPVIRDDISDEKEAANSIMYWYGRPYLLEWCRINLAVSGIHVVLGFYNKARDVTKDRYHNIVGRGDILVSLLENK
ncbi:MAG: hypothetical protein WCI62_04965, partial [Erysipelotrichaceae bacterium]